MVRVSVIIAIVALIIAVIALILGSVAVHKANHHADSERHHRHPDDHDHGHRPPPMRYRGAPPQPLPPPQHSFGAHASDAQCSDSQRIAETWNDHIWYSVVVIQGLFGTEPTQGASTGAMVTELYRVVDDQADALVPFAAGDAALIANAREWLTAHIDVAAALIFQLQAGAQGTLPVNSWQQWCKVQNVVRGEADYCGTLEAQTARDARF